MTALDQRLSESQQRTNGYQCGLWKETSFKKTDRQFFLFKMVLSSTTYSVLLREAPELPKLFLFEGAQVRHCTHKTTSQHQRHRTLQSASQCKLHARFAESLTAFIFIQLELIPAGPAFACVTVFSTNFGGFCWLELFSLASEATFCRFFLCPSIIKPVVVARSLHLYNSCCHLLPLSVFNAQVLSTLSTLFESLPVFTKSKTLEEDCTCHSCATKIARSSLKIDFLRHRHHDRSLRQRSCEGSENLEHWFKTRPRCSYRISFPSAPQHAMKEPL